MESEFSGRIFFQVDAVSLGPDGPIEHPPQVFQSVSPGPEGNDLRLIDIDRIARLASNWGDLIQNFPRNGRVRFDLARFIIEQCSTEGSRILDLGCGSSNSEPMLFSKGNKQGLFSPKFCRMLHGAGFDVTGADSLFPLYDDSGQGKTEDWKFEQIDLNQPESLEVFKDNAFDLINIDRVIGHSNSGDSSPSLYLSRGGHPFVPQVEETVFRHALRVLKPGGILVVNQSNVYQKSRGPLIFSYVDLSHPSARNELKANRPEVLEEGSMRDFRNLPPPPPFCLSNYRWIDPSFNSV